MMRPSETRLGISLLELILAIAILGGSFAVLAQIAGTGTDAASEARDLSVARLLAQRKMSELLLDRYVTPVSVPESPVEVFDSASLVSYTYSVQVQPGQLDGLLAIRVTVKSESSDGTVPSATYTLDRWMIDPAMGLEEAELEAEAAREEAASGTEATI
ncbi:MAG: type II secretion system protein [Planctomycetota bacterium]